MTRLAPVCSNCGASDFVWANDLKTGGLGGGSLSLRSRGELSFGTRICRHCGHADLFLKDPTILKNPHTWRPGEFTPIAGKPVGPASPPGSPPSAPPAPPPAPTTVPAPSAPQPTQPSPPSPSPPSPPLSPVPPPPPPPAPSVQSSSEEQALPPAPVEPALPPPPPDSARAEEAPKKPARRRSKPKEGDPPASG